MFDRLAVALAREPELEFAVLVGSRAANTARPSSAWDIALQWKPELQWLNRECPLGRELMPRAVGSQFCLD